MTTVRVAYLVLIALSAIASGFFSGSETALIGIQKERVHQLTRLSKRGARVRQLVDDPDRLLSTLLIANNLVNILGAAVATTLFIDLLGESWGPWVSVAAVTTMILIVGEITPKSLAAPIPGTIFPCRRPDDLATLRDPRADCALFQRHNPRFVAPIRSFGRDDGSRRHRRRHQGVVGTRPGRRRHRICRA